MQSRAKFLSRGQALLIVVLAMVVALTVGLSLAARSIVNLRTSTEETNSQQAFSAAEAGVEQALKLGTLGNGIIKNQALGNGTISSVDAVAVGGAGNKQFLFNNGNPLFQDDGADLWLSDYSSDPTKIYANQWPGGTVQVYWGSNNDPCKDAAIEVILIYGNKTTPQIQRFTFDPCSARITAGNNFTLAAGGSGTVSGKKLLYSGSFSVNAGQGLIARIIPLYSGTPVGVIASADLPSQGELITSTGISGGAAGTVNVQRKITYYQGYESMPSEFFYSLFTPK
ncbi:MAG: hypothetical protein ACREGI_02130 [Candidatus Levyibacteriota bacterium]